MFQFFRKEKIIKAKLDTRGLQICNMFKPIALRYYVTILRKNRIVKSYLILLFIWIGSMEVSHTTLC